MPGIRRHDTEYGDMIPIPPLPRNHDAIRVSIRRCLLIQVAVATLLACGAARADDGKGSQTVECPAKARPLSNDPVADSGMIDFTPVYATLLKNVKAIAGKNDLIRKSFYTDDNLKRVFGGLDVERTHINSSEWMIYVRKIGIISDRCASTRRFRGFTAEIYVKSLSESETSGISEVRAVIYIGYDPRFTAQLVENVFGAKYDIAERLERSPDAKSPVITDDAVMRPTNYLGNKIIRYESARRGISNVVSFWFSYDGTVRSVSIIQKVAR